MLNYFNFKKFEDRYLITNDLGKYLFLNANEFWNLISTKGNLCSGALKDKLMENAFVYNSDKESFVSSYKNEMISSKNYLFHSTQLHIFVVCTVCNTQCQYCQAQNGDIVPHGYMSKETARKAVDIALQSPSRNLQFEFQGGEPLLNFEIIKFIIEYTKENAKDKNISYSIVSNLTLLTDEIADFIVCNDVSICTSLDGPEKLHNYNRPMKCKGNSYQQVKDKILYLKKRNIAVGALQTTTKESLKYTHEIVDTYINLEFNDITIRPLTPLGCANKNWNEIGYTAEEFLDFYAKIIEYIIKVNKDGKCFSEGTAKLLLQKILNGCFLNYMELRSPCGASIGQCAYYYNGNIYTCDEGRMISEMGNDSFLLGTVNDDYNTLIESSTCKAVCIASTLEALPSCSDCVYQPYCGVCPAVNYALYSDLYEKSPENYRCKIYKGILDIIFNYLYHNQTDIINIFRSWLI